MTTYFLLSDGDRSMITTIPEVAGFHSAGKPVAAKSWLAAKLAFGFELTPIQAGLLAAQR